MMLRIWLKENVQQERKEKKQRLRETREGEVEPRERASATAYSKGSRVKERGRGN